MIGVGDASLAKTNKYSFRFITPVRKICLSRLMCSRLPAGMKTGSDQWVGTVRAQTMGWNRLVNWSFWTLVTTSFDQDHRESRSWCVFFAVLSAIIRYEACNYRRECWQTTHCIWPFRTSSRSSTWIMLTCPVHECTGQTTVVRIGRNIIHHDLIVTYNKFKMTER